MQRPTTRGAAANAGLIFHIFAQDSTSTTGAGKASIAYSSWTCRYIRNGEGISGAITPEDITTIGTYAAPTANTNIRIKAVDNTEMIGVYEIQLHLDWVNVTNTCQSLTIYLTASGVAVLPLQIPLVGFNPQDGVRMGMTALPNAAADAAGGLPISDAGGLDLDAKLANTNEVTVARMGALTDWINGGRLDLIIDTLAVQATVDSAIGGMNTKLDTIDNFLDTEIDAIKLITDRVAGMIELDGAVYRYTANALELAPTGGTALTAQEVRDAMKLAPTVGAPAGGSVDDHLDLAALEATLTTMKQTTAGTFDRDTDSLEAIRNKLPANLEDLSVTDTTGLVSLSGTQTFNVTGNITGNLSGSVGSVSGNVTGSIGSLATQAKADVNAEADAALVDVNLDHLVGTATGIPAVVAGTYIDQMMDDGTATYDRTTDSLQAIRDRGDAAWITGSSSGDWTATEKEQIRYRIGIDGTESAPATNTDLNLGTVTANMTQIAGVSVSTSTAQLGVNIVNLGGSAVAAASGYIKVSEGTGTGQLSLSSGVIAANVTKWSGGALVTPNVTGVPVIDLAYINGSAATAGSSVDANVVSIANNVITGDAIADSGANDIADTLYKRDVDQVESAAAAHSLATAVLKTVSKIVDNGSGQLITYQTDGTTVKLTQAISTDATLVSMSGLGVGT